jgi:hypothetical protein
MDQSERDESFEEFRQSFSYGARNDLSFKFLKSLSDDATKDFIQRLLDELGNSYDTGDVLPLIQEAIDAQIAGYAPDPGAAPPRHASDEGPFTPFDTSVTTARVGLLTTSGHFVAGDDPMPFGESGLTQSDAVDRIAAFMKDKPVLSEIPSDTPAGDLLVRHGGYDIRSAMKDPNVTFPIERLAHALDIGRIGDVAATFFSFPGATSQGRLRHEIPGWVDRINQEDIDIMLLVPV